MHLNFFPVGYNIHVLDACSDKLIELAAGGTAVADIFKLHGETFFRNNEVSL